MNLERLVHEAIHAVNEQHRIEALNTLDDDTPLFELLDSLGTLDLILELEARLEHETKRYIAVADALSMDKEHTPFKTTKRLKAYLATRIADE